MHTKRAVTAYNRLARSYREQGLITEFEEDCGRAAILLHDVLKYGELSDEVQDEIITCLEETNSLPTGRHTERYHDDIAANVLSRETELPKEVIGCVATHNGPWCGDEKPQNDLQQLHHMADMIASSRNAEFMIKGLRALAERGITSVVGRAEDD
ncbi:HD domain-containing protein [Halogeometricum borinquense]|uniref:HD domain-containing protein n=1 Tax=Halogeometricum borinquense TaxID=60847 RepID=UPI0023BA6002|nr:HD domain-containing protein [Halogeometricum borinquense]